jgi:hypothetical protein
VGLLAAGTGDFAVVRQWHAQESLHRYCPGAMHRVAYQHLNRFQFEASALVPSAKDNLKKPIYFLGDLALDDFRRFFSCVVSVSSTGRAWQICSFTSTKERLNSWYCRNAAISASVLRCAAGLAKLSDTVLPSDL